jgi:hypothetical protein
MEAGGSYRIEKRAARDDQGRDYKDAGSPPAHPDGPLMPWRLYMNLLRDARHPLHPARLVRRDKVNACEMVAHSTGEFFASPMIGPAIRQYPEKDQSYLNNTVQSCSKSLRSDQKQSTMA